MRTGAPATASRHQLAQCLTSAVVDASRQRRKELLEQVLDGGSVVAVLQRLTSQALTLVRTPALVPPEGMEPSNLSTCVEALPGTFQGEQHGAKHRQADCYMQHPR